MLADVATAHAVFASTEWAWLDVGLLLIEQIHGMFLWTAGGADEEAPWFKWNWGDGHGGIVLKHRIKSALVIFLVLRRHFPKTLSSHAI